MRFHWKKAVAAALALAVTGGSFVSQAQKGSTLEGKLPKSDRIGTLEMRIPKAHEGMTMEGRSGISFLPEDLPNGETMIGSFDENSMLTAEEKAQLERTKRETAPLYDEIERLEAEVERISKRILGEYVNGEEQVNRLYGRNQSLWEKLERGMEDDDWDLSKEDRIRVSDVLTSAEKETLLRDLLEINALESLLDEKYEEIDRVTADLEDELAELYDEVWEFEFKDLAIWERIYGYMTVPYMPYVTLR